MSVASWENTVNIGCPGAEFHAAFRVDRRTTAPARCLTGGASAGDQRPQHRSFTRPGGARYEHVLAQERELPPGARLGDPDPHRAHIDGGCRVGTGRLMGWASTSPRLIVMRSSPGAVARIVSRSARHAAASASDRLCQSVIDWPVTTRSAKTSVVLADLHRPQRRDQGAFTKAGRQAVQGAHRLPVAGVAPPRQPAPPHRLDHPRA